jgi:signal transduction histidine kinase
MGAEDLNTPATEGAAGSAGGPSPWDWERLLELEIVLSAILAFGLTLIWAFTGHGYFWPMWVWWGLGLPIAFQVGLRHALAAPHDRWRRFAFHKAAFSVVAPALIVLWVLNGFGVFWPIFPLVILGSALGLHYWVLKRLPSREAELAERVDVLTRTRRGALDVQDAELRRIERDLHDGAQARLVALSMQLGRAEERLAGQPEAAELVRSARGEAGAAIAELRDLARGIAPPVLADRGLEAAVDALGQRAQIPVTAAVELGERPPAVVETAAYFVVAEAVTNVAKHAGGAGAEVRVSRAGDELVVQVSDRGPGGAVATGGGLTGLRHRVEALDGTLAVTSPAGEGTTIEVRLPCA